MPPKQAPGRLLPLIPAVLVLSMACLAAGCGLRNIAPAKSDIEIIRAGRVTAVTCAPARFIAEYPELLEEKYNEGMYGYWRGTWEWMFEWSALEKEGGRLVRDFGLEDPAIRVRDGLSGWLEKDLGFRQIVRGKEPLNDNSIRALRKRFGTGGLLDFETTSWRLSHSPSDWKRYRVSLKVRGRLIDLGRSEVLWRASCSFTTKAGLSFDELTANNGERLKEMFLDAADHCADELEAGLRF